MNFELFMCTRYLITRDKHSITYLINILAVTGIAIGVMVLTVSISIMTGFQKEFERRILNVDPHILVVKNGNSINDYNYIVDNLNELEGVESVYPVVYSQVLFRGVSSLSSSFMKGIDFTKITPTSSFFSNIQMDSGEVTDHLKSFSNQKGPFPIILGTVLASKLGVSSGDIIYFVSPIGSNILSNFLPFRVFALLKTGIYQYDEMVSYVNINDAQVLLNSGSKVANVLEIKVSSINDSVRVAEEVRDQVGFEYSVTDWTEMNANFFLMLKIQKITIYTILFLIIIIATVSIASAMTMTVMDKISEISILKTIGVSNFSIKKIFIFRGMFIGLLGNIIGLLLGLFICNLLSWYDFIELPEDIYSLSKFPLDVNNKDVIIIFLVTFAICFLFSLYPANKASLLYPIKGIRSG